MYSGADTELTLLNLSLLKSLSHFCMVLPGKKERENQLRRCDDSKLQLQILNSHALGSLHTRTPKGVGLAKSVC